MDYLKILEDLVKIKTDNKFGVKEAFKYLSRIFNSLNIKNDIIKGCFVAYKKKEHIKSPNLILNSHIDTVKIQSTFKKDDKNFYGTGVIDAKGNVVLMIHAFLNSSNSILVISPDEETNSDGIYNFCKYLKEKMGNINKNSKIMRCVVGEPTDLKLCIGHKGRFEYIVECLGISKHASSLNCINPIEIASKVILDLKMIQMGNIKIDKVYYSSITPTIIRGGIQSNIIPDHTCILFDVRSVENNLIKRIEEFLNKREYSKYIKHGLNLKRHYADFYILKNDDLINNLSKNFIISFFNATCEAYYFNKFLNAEAMIYGVGNLDLAHSKEEYLNLNEFNKGIKNIEKLVDELENYQIKIF